MAPTSNKPVPPRGKPGALYGALACICRGIGRSLPGPAVTSWVEALAAADPARKTRMEYSLHINNGRLDGALRLVNYDRPYREAEAPAYFRRLELAERLAAALCGGRATRGFFSALREHGRYRLPVFLGLESGASGGLRLKLYVNFFGVYSQSRALGSKVVRKVLASVNPALRPGRREVPLFAMTLGPRGVEEYKIYYLYPGDYPPGRLRPGETEAEVFDWLLARNKRDYFSVMHRLSPRGRRLSRKFEVRPKSGARVLSPLLKLSGCAGLLPRVKGIIDNTRGSLEVITLEGGGLNIYVTFAGYDNDKEHVRH